MLDDAIEYLKQLQLQVQVSEMNVALLLNCLRIIFANPQT